MEDPNNTEDGAVDAFMKGPMATKIALGAFLFAKVCGICTVPAIYTNRTLAIVLVSVSSALLILAMVCCGYDMHQQNKKERENQDEATLRRLMKTGQLDTLLKAAQSHGSGQNRTR